MKYRTFIIGLALVLCVTLTACGRGAPAEDYTPSADENPFVVETGYKKPEITLDGVLDEAVWKDLQVLSFGDEAATTVKSFYGENGIYIGAEVKDNELWGTSSNVYDNSSFEVYIDCNPQGEDKPEADQIEIFIDVNEQSLVRRGNGGVWEETSLIKNYAVRIDGTTGAKNGAKGYCVELFVPYSQLGGDSKVDYGITFGVVICRDNARVQWSGPAAVNAQSPKTYLRFYRDTNSVEPIRKVNTAAMKIDGLANEPAWRNSKAYSFGDDGRGCVMSCFDGSGCTFFFRMKDRAVCVEGSAVYLNDSVEIYLDALANGGEKPQTDDLQVRVDAKGNLEVLRGLGTGGWENTVNNVFAAAIKTDTGYDVEVFIPWADLALTQPPRAMAVSFGTVNWDGKVKNDGGRDIVWSGIGKDPQVPNNYIRLTKEGISGAQQAAPRAETGMDGVLNDDHWKGAPEFTYHDGKVKVNWVWTDKGCYMGFTVVDDYVMTDGGKPFENSSVELYLDYDANGGSPDERDRTILVDAAGNMLFRKGVNGVFQDFGTNSVSAGVKRTGDGYVVELYIPWSEFGAGKPEQMGIAFGQVTLQKGVEGTQWHNDGMCPDPQSPDWYSKITASKIG